TVLRRDRLFVAVEHDAEYFGRRQCRQRFGQQLARGLVRGDDEGEALDPPPEKPAIRQRRNRWCINEDVVVLFPRLSQQDLQARRRQQLVRPRLRNSGGKNRQVQIVETAHDLRQL